MINQKLRFVKHIGGTALSQCRAAAYNHREVIYLIIYIVEPGDTVYSVALRYGLDPGKVISDNALTDPGKLAVGQTLVLLFPEQTVTVGAGETLTQIAAENGVTVNELLRNNPSLGGIPDVTAGETLTISYSQPKTGAFEINGYAYPYIDTALLRSVLPYLSYLTLFTYGFDGEGNLIGLDDEVALRLAREYEVRPIMLLSTYTGNGFSNDLSSQLFASPETQTRLIANILTNMRTKGYAGLDIDFEYVKAAEAQDYVNFVRTVRNALSAEGYPVWVALAPKTYAAQPGLLYEGHDYAALGAAADSVLLMTYEWGYTYSEPMAVAPVDKVRAVLDYAVTEIPARKIFMGIPNYGYDWTLPYIAGQTRARSVSNPGAAELAASNGAEILFDETAQSPFFNYNSDGSAHEVWFEDARSVRSKLALVNEYGFRGGSYWNLMRPFPQNWLVLNALYNIIT